MSQSIESQPLLQVWQGPYGGLPPFSGVSVADFKPAIEFAIIENRSEIEAIANNPNAANFENTIAALENAGRRLDRVMRVYSIWTGTMTNPELQALEKEMAPRIAAFSDEVMQNAPLFLRIEAVYRSAELKSLTKEQQRLAWKYWSDFIRAGAKLDQTKKLRLSEINQRLASLFTQFNQNLLADEGSFILLKEEEELVGLSENLKASAKVSAKAHGFEGQWAIDNTRSSVEPFLVQSERSDLREKVWQSFMKRAANADARDNHKGISEILKLRKERAKLLGYETHAHWRLEKEMAKTPAAALALLEKVWRAAVGRVGEEVAEMLPLAKAFDGSQEIKPWDYRFYAERVRKLKYDVDENEIKPYFELEGLREGMFWVAGELFQFNFRQAQDIPVLHPDIRVWEVTERGTGNAIGLWFFDPYARPGKRSGAWMSSYRRQEKFKKSVTTIVSNNSNFVKGAPGEAVLISLHDAKTLFHEFGHALHGLSSNVNYPSLAGTMVPRDYVEFPSQLFEDWLLTPEVLNRFALHSKTKAPMPEDLVRKIKNAATFNQGFETLEYLASAIVDMKYHLSQDEDIDPKAFEARVLEELGMPKEMVMRHRSSQFAHIFGSDGYSAGYYSYLWADTLSAATFEAFTEAKGPYDKEVAGRLKRELLSVGNSVDPAEAFRAFLERDPDSNALMRKRGFPLSPLASN